MASSRPLYRSPPRGNRSPVCNSSTYTWDDITTPFSGVPASPSQPPESTTLSSATAVSDTGSFARMARVAHSYIESTSSSTYTWNDITAPFSGVSTGADLPDEDILLSSATTRSDTRSFWPTASGDRSYMESTPSSTPSMSLGQQPHGTASETGMGAWGSSTGATNWLAPSAIQMGIPGPPSHNSFDEYAGYSSTSLNGPSATTELDRWTLASSDFVASSVAIGMEDWESGNIVPTYIPPSSTAMLPTHADIVPTKSSRCAKEYVLRVLRSQQANGSFYFSDESKLREVIGNEVADRLVEFPGVPSLVAVTALLATLLEFQFSTLSDLWLLAVPKARTFVENSTLEVAPSEDTGLNRFPFAPLTIPTQLLELAKSLVADISVEDLNLNERGEPQPIVNEPIEVCIAPAGTA